MAIELEKIKSWDGQSGTGADNRGVIDRNFEKVKTELEENKAEIVQLAGDVKSKLGYIVCPTPASTAGKVIVNAGFILTSGMRLLVKFTNANLVDTGVTLNINSTGDKPLIFRGKPVSSFNSWKTGEVVDVYYDGTNYMAEQLDSSNTELSELLKSANAGNSDIRGKNLINSNEYATGYLRSDNGDVSQHSTNIYIYIKSYIPISSSKRYIISGFTSTTVSRVVVFYDKEGKKIDTGWDSELRYALTSVDGGTFPAGRNFYILEPEASIAPDWKTNGLATLPIPTEASYIRLNAGSTASSNTDWRDTLMLEETTALIPSDYEKYRVDLAEYTKTGGSTKTLKEVDDITDYILSSNILKESLKTNLYNPEDNVPDKLISRTNGLPAASNGTMSGDIKIDPSKTYTWSGIIKSATKRLYSVTIAFRDSNKIRIPYTEYDWDEGYSIDYTLEGANLKESFDFVPLNEVKPDWKTNGENILPMPLNAEYVAFNVITGSPLIDLSNVLVFGEKTGSTTYKKYGESELDFERDFVKEFMSNLSLKKIQTLPIVDGYVHGGNGDILLQAPVGDLVYRSSNVIQLNGAKSFEIFGRATTDIENPSKGGIVFYDDDDNKYKPVNSEGVSYPSYYLPYENGIAYVPESATKFQMVVCFKAEIETGYGVGIILPRLDEDIKVRGKEFYNIVKTNPVVADGELMIKQGHSFIGISKKELGGAILLADDYDGIYRIINYVASAIQKTQSLEIVPVNMNPVATNPTIYYKDGNLYFKVGEVIKKIQLID